LKKKFLHFRGRADLISICIGHKFSFVALCVPARKHKIAHGYKDVLMAAKILRRHVSAADKKAEKRFMYHYND